MGSWWSSVSIVTIVAAMVQVTLIAVTVLAVDSRGGHVGGRHREVCLDDSDGGGVSAEVTI